MLYIQSRGDGMSGIPVVIVARNSLGLTKLAVKSVLAQDTPVDLLVVDNASTDGTGAWLRSKHFTFMFTDEQWSLARCWNNALRTLWYAGHDRALVVNNDVELVTFMVKYLSAYMEHQELKFVTGIGVDHPQQIKKNETEALDWSYHIRPHPDFSCFMIHKDVTDKIGFFDEEFFPAYCEDSDYHVRMYRAGIKAVSVELPFLHHGASTLKNASLAEQNKIRRGADRNRERFRQKYGCLPGSDEYQELFR
jgi:GT2 family glycosyltransferase